MRNAVILSKGTTQIDALGRRMRGIKKTKKNDNNNKKPNL